MRIPRVLLVACIVLMLGDFVVRGLIPAFGFGKNDFSDPYCGSWLWRHGQNPYDPALATAVNRERAKSSVLIVPVYPPSTYALVAPLSTLPWKWANLIWTLVGIGGVGLSIVALLQISGFTAKDNSKWILAAAVLAASPFHTAIHVANVAALATGLCLWAFCLAEKQHDLAAGLALAFAGCLKPQLGIWILIFYLLRRRWVLVLATSAAGLLITAVAVARMPLSVESWLSQYGLNLQYWFKPGGINDFTSANSLRFELVNSQAVLHSFAPSATATNILAWSLFGIGFMIWAQAALRPRGLPDVIALPCLLALGLLPVYHRSYDMAILTAMLPWALRRPWKQLTMASRATLLLLALLLLVPGQSAIVRLIPHLRHGISTSLWWVSGLSVCEAWGVFLLNGMLLFLLANFKLQPIVWKNKTSLPDACGSFEPGSVRAS